MNRETQHKIMYCYKCKTKKFQQMNISIVKLIKQLLVLSSCFTGAVTLLTRTDQ